MRKELLAFNRGKISPLALARADFKRTALSSEVQTNWMPRALGSMMLRAGLEYKGGQRNNAFGVCLPFIFATEDTARLEFTDGVMRVWVDDALVTRPSVSAAVANGAFTSDLSSWTDQDGGSAVSAWATGGYMSLVGTGNAAARRRQAVTVSQPGTRHALNIVVARGPVKLRVGSTAGGDEYVSETDLRTGAHSLAFTPTGTFYIDLFNYNARAGLVDSVTVAGAGIMEVAAPWAEADLRAMRWDQSGDVVFVACKGYQQRRIERRASDSWSIVLYESDDGPFRVQNTGPITLAPGATSGDTTLTASAALFRPGHVGALFRLTQTGQSATVEVTGADQFSDPIRVTGIDGSRVFSIVITGTWSATVTLQYSVGEPGDWIDAASGSYTSNTAVSYDDELENEIVYYRIGVKSGGYTSGTVNASLVYTSGSQTGVARVTGYSSATQVSIGIIRAFGNATATSDWSEGDWSDYRGWTASVGLYEGRMWWAGKNKIKGSISDSYSAFDDEYEGDAAPIQRTIGAGPVDNINWLVPLQRLLLGTDGSIWTARSSSFDEPLTPTNFNLKDVSTQGARNVNPVKVDASAIFVQRSGTRLYEAVYDSASYDYRVNDLTTHVPEIGQPGIVRLAVQRQPETRVHCIRSDGTVAILVLDHVEEVVCWVDFETDGVVEDIVVEPGDVEDRVTYTVRRTVAGASVRYHERWAMESECVGGTLNKQADSFVAVSGSGETIGGLSHLEGRSVICWADGEDKGTFTVSGGAIAQPYTAGAVVGLPYEASYKSTKLTFATKDGTSTLCQLKRIRQLGIVARNMHARGLRYGPDFSDMDYLPLVEQAGDIATDTVWPVYDQVTFEFPGEMNTDSRLCLKAAAPRPVTLLAAVLSVEVSEK